MTRKRAFEVNVWARCFIVNKQMLGHKFTTKSLWFIYSLKSYVVVTFGYKLVI